MARGGMAISHTCMPPPSPPPMGALCAPKLRHLRGQGGQCEENTLYTSRSRELAIWTASSGYGRAIAHAILPPTAHLNADESSSPHAAANGSKRRHLRGQYTQYQ